MARPDDLTDILTAAPTGPSQPMAYRSGIIEAFDKITLSNRVKVGGAILTDLPLLGIAEATTYEAGDVCGIIVVGNTWALVGQFVIPGSPEAETAISVPSSNEYTAGVTAGETTSSTPFVNLTTPGPSLDDVRIGPSGRCRVELSAYILLDTVTAAPASAHMGFTIAGASTLATDVARALSIEGAEGAAINATRSVLVEGLTPGLHTVTAKYNMTGGTAYYSDRVLTVQAL